MILGRIATVVNLLGQCRVHNGIMTFAFNDQSSGETHADQLHGDVGRSVGQYV